MANFNIKLYRFLNSRKIRIFKLHYTPKTIVEIEL
jgi:hypothetical protein